MRYIFLPIILITLLSCKPNNKVKTDKIPNTPHHQGVLTSFKTITFPSKDGLLITGDLYEVNNSKNYILLCHQAGFSRGEYIETAKKLNKMGYSCLAIDQRSGKEVKHVINETAKRAKEKGLATTYIDAKPDIIASIDYVYKLNNNKQLILVGSSYSAALSLVLATTNKKVKAVAAFSPGEYLKGIDVNKSIRNLDKPVFVTSSKEEIKQVTAIIKNIKSKKTTHFKPEEKSIHGSRALWSSTKGNEACWASFSSFLKGI